MSRKHNPQDLKVMRSLVQAMGWGEFMSHVSGLMAEQADKVPRDSEQDVNLFQCSNTLNALNQFFVKCGEFDYVKVGEAMGSPDMVFQSIISGDYTVS